MKTSIAMATFNGAKYLQEQLDSFLAQTRLPDELIVCDDGSDDDTLAILRAFQKTAPFHVEISENQTILGCTKNFEKAASLCTGDLIFFSDQDDVWFKNKLEVMIQFMENHPQVMVAVNDAEIVDEKLLPGCCMVFRSKMKGLFLPVPDYALPYDTWLNRLALRLDCREFVNEPLQYYRRHRDNTSAWIVNSTRKIKRFDMAFLKAKDDTRHRCKQRILGLEALKNRIIESNSPIIERLEKNGRIDNCIVQLNAEIETVRLRLALLERPLWCRGGPAVAMLFSGRYKKYFSGWPSFFKDIVRK
jgi:glycosyltransferase involved in cell wall biosynthesis